MSRTIKSIFAFFIISMCMAPAALAAGDAEYRIDPLGITVSIPDNYLTLTRDIDQKDPVLKDPGYDAQALIEFFESKFIYLDAVAPDFSHEYSVKMPDIGGADKPDDFNLYTDAQEETLRHSVDSVRFDRVASGLFSITKNGFYIFGINIGKVVGGTIAAAIVGGIAGLVLSLTSRSRRKKAGAAAGDGEPSLWSQPYPPVNMPYEGPQYTPPSRDEFNPTPEQVVCPNCLSSNWSDRTVCTECGAKLER